MIARRLLAFADRIQGTGARWSRLLLLVAASTAMFTVTASPALAANPEAPTIEEAFVTNVASTSATLGAKLNPGGASTTYTFESAPAGGSFTPVLEPGGSGALPEGTSGVPVSVHVAQGLNPNAVYEFRLTASNSVKSVTGEIVSFTTQGSGEFALPDGRRWEMVSPPQKQGASIFGEGREAVFQAAANGDALSYRTNSPTEANPPGYSRTEQVLSTRGPDGWGSEDISVPHAQATGVQAEQGEYQFFSTDLSQSIAQPLGFFEPAISPEASEQTAFLRSDFANDNVSARCAASCYRPLVTGKPGYANVPPGTEFGKYDTESEFICSPYQHCGPQFGGATPDLKHVMLRSEVPLTSDPVEAPKTRNEYTYEWSAGKLTPVGVLPDGLLSNEAEIGGNDGTEQGRAISADGSRVAWTQPSTLQEPGIYLRDTAKGETLKLAAEGRFQTIAADGLKAFFTSVERLTPNSGAMPAAPDLYQCEVVELAGKLQCKLSDLTPAGALNEPASVRGFVLGAGEDGSYVYFVANGILAPGAVRGECHGSAPETARCNLYVSHNGTVKLVAVLSQLDDLDWATDAPAVASLADMTARVSPNGRWLTFISERPLTGYDNRDALTGSRDREVFLYDAESGHLACASCDPTGARPGSAGTTTGLVAGGSGEVQRRFAAIIPTWTRVGTPHAAYRQPRFLSDSGRLFFDSYEALVSQDGNGTWDVYEYEPEGVPEGAHACSSRAGSGSVVFRPARSFEVESRRGEEGAGCVGLISSGTSKEESAFVDASENGADVFFLTNAKLSTQDTDTALDVYDAHECSGASPCLPQPAALPPPCTTEASCKAAPTPQPDVFGTPASGTFSGPGNLVPQEATKPAGLTPAQIRAQKLAKALRTCRAKKNKKKRAACEKQANRKKQANRIYGPTKAKKARVGKASRNRRTGQ